ncbi:MAG: M48 family metallopeptidase [Acidobacteriia bacterium]|nr:M48 family metallopeptidase [Terriglobia bacterium]
MHSRTLICVFSLILVSGPVVLARQAGAVTPASPVAPFDVKAAVDAYLAGVPADARARSDAYFEGGYWLMLWDYLCGAGVALILLGTRLSAKMRDSAERITRFKPLQTAIYWTEFLIITTVLTFPLTVYEGFFRERKYGLMNQTFADWFGDSAKQLLVSLILVGVLVTALFGIVRRLPRTWWIWGSIVSIVFLMFSILISPVCIAPLTNTYTRLQDERVRQPILSMARANGIPATDVWEVDASRQSNRVSANVSGFLDTERITLNDNLLKRCTLPEIETVMGHEMGHYVLNHIYKDIMFFGIVALVFFAFLRWSLDWSLARWGQRWGVRGVGDTAVLPLVVLLGSIFFFVMTPVNNSWVRVQEYEADIFGLNAARQPDAEARVDLMLGEYRKLDPGRLEEILFYDHPSGRTRITAAMRWKAEHLAELQGAPGAPAREARPLSPGVAGK